MKQTIHDAIEQPATRGASATIARRRKPHAAPDGERGMDHRVSSLLDTYRCTSSVLAPTYDHMLSAPKSSGMSSVTVTFGFPSSSHICVTALC